MQSQIISAWARWCIACVLVGAGYFYVTELVGFFSWEGYVGHPKLNRLLIPDTFFYRTVARTGSPLDWFSSAIKNAAGPAALWWLGRDSYLGVLAINSALFVAIPWQARRVALELDLPTALAGKVAIIAMLLPASAYHMIGALKELPTALLLLTLSLAYLRGQPKKMIFYSAVLIIFRLQWLPILTLFIVLKKIARLSPGASLRLVMLFFAAFPLLRRVLPSTLLGPETVANLRSGRAGSGAGALIESVRDNVPGLSSLAIVARAVQSLAEPLVSLANRGFSFHEDGRLSVILVAYVATVVLMVKPLFVIGRGMIGTLRSTRSFADPRLEPLLVMTGVALLMIGGAGIVHFRYLTPLFPIVIVVAFSIEADSSSKAREVRRSRQSSATIR